ncbi:glycoside hydrolase family 17 protein [Mixia osmundae IAM 14324]|uniref:glucan endo-1,3-beta-D-glucosidase n=1 Tax=Mixia osmundae (strain CBS 9802 / IAM 14324 / JCM 22182 / KY 12970) TaxID=764103 RepID=G7DYB7_MIXOS|nr:glycoside hydrolase family 17 protein [Mixia osmundae IAM 14324]KEI41479.1 glycoside hydrolase family 17 protein [Mixia osmundae IAM 14324]GAA95577.1 hypothetical protein E5Q_02232 [Mixia osmundae IAM 14324]
MSRNQYPSQYDWGIQDDQQPHAFASQDSFKDSYPPTPSPNMYNHSSASDYVAQSHYARRNEADAPYGADPNYEKRSAAVAEPTWLQRQQASKKKSKIILICCIVAVACAAVVGVVIGITKSKKSSSSSSDSSSSSSSSSGSDPSVFTKDSRLHQSFWGMAYTPLNAQMPGCGSTLANVTRDIQLLSQLTTNMRTYGSDCSINDNILQAIADTKVNMTVWLGIYLDMTNSTTNERQIQQTLDAISKHGSDHVSGVIVGNEVVLLASPTGGTPSTTAISFVVEQQKDVRTRLAALNLSKTIPVGTADAGSMMTTSLAEGSDALMSNVHPFFGGLLISQAAAWTYEYFQTSTVAVAAAASNNPAVFIAETGWPTNSTNADGSYNSTDDTLGGAVAGVPELQTFLDTYLCQSLVNNTKSFYFEAFDEPWKELAYGGVESHWGLFDADRNLKNITIPVC